MGPQSFSAYRLPSRGSVQQNDFEEFQFFENQIPFQDGQYQAPPHRNLHPNLNTSQTSLNNSDPVVRRKSLVRSLFWPVLIIITPITLLATALLSLVYAYKVVTDPDLFQLDATDGSNGSSSHILVNFSATRLVFVASFLSSVAPLLASVVMTLWSLPIAASMRTASAGAQYSHLPTPYQLSLVIGITLASYERLWRYLVYLCSRSRSSIPPVVHKAALMLILTTLLAVAVFLADTALHYSTQTVPFNQITRAVSPDLQYGRGLNELCLSFDRVDNIGFPCSYDVTGNDPNYLFEYNEVFRLEHNNSQISELLVIKEDSLDHGDLVILAQQDSSLQPDVDYRASTIGVSTQCLPITSRCNMRTDPADEAHTLFNCSENFWGVLGQAPVVSPDFTKVYDPDVPSLAFKPQSNLQYGFYNDSKLNLFYNSVGYNASGAQALPPLSDAELINPMYFGLAGRILFSEESAGSQINNDSEVFIRNSSYSFFDFALSCVITSYDVNLTWANGFIQSTSFTPTTNGSVLEIFHGDLFYVTVSTATDQLQDFLEQVALQNTTEALAREWGNLYSTKVLSTIGGYTTPRTNLAQQQRTALLVASVPKWALGALVACSLAYTVLGLSLVLAAYRASAVDVRDLAAQLSLVGLIAAAFGDKTATPLTADSDFRERETFNQKLTREETRRIGVDGDQNQGFGYRVWV